MNTPSPEGLLRKKVTNVSGLNRYCHEQNSWATTLPRTEDTEERIPFGKWNCGKGFLVMIVD